MSRNTVTCLVKFPQPSEMEMNAPLVLDHKLTRQSQKLNTLTKYVQQYPSSWKKRLELAEVLYAMGRWEQAVEEYGKVLEQQPRLAEVWLKLGKILQLVAREAEAVAVYKHALTLTQNVATQHHLMGAIATCRHLFQTAASAFESAATLEPDRACHWLALGQTYLSQESPRAALAAFDRVLLLDPNEIKALNHSYEALMAMGRVREAERRMRRSLALAPQDIRTLKRMADGRCHRGFLRGEEGKQTRHILRAALRLAPHAAETYESMAYYHLFRGEWKKGVAVLHKFVEQHPNCPSGWYHYARGLFYTGESQAAAEAILKAYALYPNDCKIYRSLCEILPEAGKLETLKPLLEEMLEKFPERWSVWVTAGRVLVEHFQDVDGGCTVSGCGPQLQPQLADPWFQHGRVLALAGKHQEAVDAIDRGWLWLPEEGGHLQAVPAAVWLGESYQALGDDGASHHWWEEARDRAQELMDFNPAIARYWQGRALGALEDVEAAKSAYQSALTYANLP